MKVCQMTIGGWDSVTLSESYGKCGRPAKFKNPTPKMGVEFVCGIHARSLDKMYERTGSKLRCLKLWEGEVNESVK